MHMFALTCAWRRLDTVPTQLPGALTHTSCLVSGSGYHVLIRVALLNTSLKINFKLSH